MVCREGYFVTEEENVAGAVRWGEGGIDVDAGAKLRGRGKRAINKGNGDGAKSTESSLFLLDAMV